MRQPKELIKITIPFLSAIVFCALIFLFYPYRTTFQFDTDEGVNLAKARLVENGYPLYQQVWSDQPPVFTLALASIFPFVEEDLNTARHLVLAFAGLLVASLVYLVQKIWSPWYALPVVLLLLLIPYFPQLSVSIMIGLPAISLAFASLAALVAWHTQPHPAWLLLSGAALGLSVMTKLFTGFLAPVFLIGICLGAATRRPGNRTRFNFQAALTPLWVWSTAFGIIVLGLGWVVIGQDHLAALILPHLEAGVSKYYQGYQEEFSRFVLLSEAWPVLVLAAFGAWDAVMRRRWLALYLLAWMAGGLGFFAFVSPAWYHHTLLASLPAVCLAAGGVGEVASRLANLFRRRKLLLPQGITVLAGLALLAVLLWQRLPPVWEEFDHQPYFIALRSAQPPREQIVLDEITSYQEQVQWMFTDLPIYAFRANFLVPPELAVMTSKRLASGDLSQTEIARLVREYRPEVILIGRFEFPGLSEILTAEYVLKSSHLDTRLYLRADLPDLE